MTIENAINDLTSANTDLVAAVLVKKLALDTATASATANANAAATASGSAVTAQSLAQAAASQASTARDSAVTAWQASTAPTETLAGMSQTLHAGTPIKVIIYDTADDRDGGNWRKRCTHTSWYQEPIFGTWRGQRANEAACRGVAGVVSGDYYQSTTDNLFYALSVGSGQAQVYRGGTREFPARVAIVVESARIVIYDLTRSGAPMWMVFKSQFLTWATANIIFFPNISALAAMHGAIAFTDSTTGDGSLTVINFLADGAAQYKAATNYGGSYRGLIADRNALRGYIAAANTGLPAMRVTQPYDVCMAILPGAPVCAAGLAVPTIAVAGLEGISILHNNGTVANISISANAPYSIARSLSFTNDNKLIYVMDAVSSGRYIRVDSIPDQSILHAAYSSKSASSEFYVSTSGNGVGDIYLSATAVTNAVFSGNGIGSNLGLIMLHRNPSTPARTMLCNITSAYNTGWLVGDMRGAWLADTSAGAVAATESDRSYKNLPLALSGALTKTAVANGAQLCGYSGFSAVNYLGLVNVNLDFGTGDFSVMCWAKMGIDFTLLYRGLDTSSVSPANGINIWSYPDTTIKTYIGGVSLISAPIAISNSYNHIVIMRVSGVVQIWINGVLSGSVANTANLTLANAITRIGSGYYVGSGSLSMLRVSGTAPSTNQIAKIYQDELALFQAGAQCNLAGTSDAVTTMAYDAGTDVMHVTTSYGRSSVKGIVRVDAEATTLGPLTCLAVSKNAILTGGASVKIYQPPLSLRDALGRQSESCRDHDPIQIDVDATLGQTAFPLLRGWVARSVSVGGVIKRRGPTKDYFVSSDGFIETVNFYVAPGAGVWVSLLVVRG